MVLAALSQLLQLVSGGDYPPGLSDVTALQQRLAAGKLVGAYCGALRRAAGRASSRESPAANGPAHLVPARPWLLRAQVGAAWCGR